MKQISTILFILLSLCEVCYSQTSSSYTNNSTTNDLEKVNQAVISRINNGNSSSALEYLKMIIKNNPPEDANVEFGYAALAQRITAGLSQDGMKAAMSMDLASAMSISFNIQEASQLEITLLANAAAKGHKGASQMIQLKASMYGGGNYNNSTPTNNNSGGSSVGQKTCSYCNGKGWVSGSKTATYGNTSTHWCNDCQRTVNASHSHDSCPSCGGKGYR